MIGHPEEFAADEATSEHVGDDGGESDGEHTEANDHECEPVGKGLGEYGYNLAHVADACAESAVLGADGVGNGNGHKACGDEEGKHHAGYEVEVGEFFVFFTPAFVEEGVGVEEDHVDTDGCGDTTDDRSEGAGGKSAVFAVSGKEGDSGDSAEQGTPLDACGKGCNGEGEDDAPDEELDHVLVDF